VEGKGKRQTKKEGGMDEAFRREWVFLFLEKRIAANDVLVQVCE
jgi:hypothetical protein